MATFSTDFTSDSGDAQSSTPTTIAGFTFVYTGSSTTTKKATIVADTNPTGGGGKICRLQDPASVGSAAIMHCTASGFGDLAANTVAEVLVCWRHARAPATPDSFVMRGLCPGLRSGNTNGTNGTWYVAPVTIVHGATPADTLESRVYEVNTGTSIASSSTPPVRTAFSGYTATEWWWTRFKVDASGVFSVKYWENGTPEPGSYESTALTDTTQTSGYCGFGAYSMANVTYYAPLDVAWFGAGTGGDAAPGPAAAGGVIRPRGGTMSGGTQELLGGMRG